MHRRLINGSKNKLFKGGLKEVSKNISRWIRRVKLPNKERYIQEMTEKAEAEAKKTAKKIIQAAEDQATALKEEVEANLENIKQEAQKTDTMKVTESLY